MQISQPIKLIVDNEKQIRKNEEKRRKIETKRIKIEQQKIKSQCQSKGSSFQEVLDEASKLISGLSNHAGIVVAPKYQNSKNNKRI